jgi:hypothetical protein
MSNEPKSLWPPDIFPVSSSSESSSERTPIDVLVEQGKVLSKFQNKILANVVNTQSDHEGFITVAFYLMNIETEYNYRLLSFEQKIDTIYPFSISAFSNPAASLYENITDIVMFENTLIKILQDKRTKTVVQNLLYLT